ncbi:MAG: TauD/TfdA family dioxygenase [Alphaproteobacteria bacterium]
MHAAISGPCAWRGEEMQHSRRWIFEMSDGALAEIDKALRACQAQGIPWHETTREAFPLPALAGTLAAVARELEEGSGMAKLRHLPVERYTADELRQIWFGIGSNLGRPLFQNRHGELMREIRDEGPGIGERYGEIRDERSGGQTVLSSYARTLSNGALRFHTDRADVVGLLCAQQARAGGVSRLASSAAVHNEMLKRRPDLVELLYGDYVRSRFGEEATVPEDVYALPIFGVAGGKFTSHYSLTYIEMAQMVPGTPPLSAAQRQAIDMLMALAGELAFEMTLEAGDMQFLNNHVIYHGRTPFEDDAASGRARLLYRLWLSLPNSRPLPAGQEVLWGTVAAGALRGGIGQCTQSAAS